jgi:hypothetical protein
MKRVIWLLSLLLPAFLVGCSDDPSFVYSIAPQAITSNKQAELRSSVVSLAHKYRLHAIQLASAQDPDAIAFVGSPCLDCPGISDDENRYRLSFAYSPRRNVIVIQLLYGPDERGSSRGFRMAVEAELTRSLGANGFSVEKGNGVRSLAS